MRVSPFHEFTFTATNLVRIIAGAFLDNEDLVSVHNPEDELDLPDYEKGLSSLDSNSNCGSSSKAFSTTGDGS